MSRTTEPLPSPTLELPELLREPVGRSSVVWSIVIASICFALGIVGWLVPIVTGVPFYIAGLVALAPASRRLRHALNRWDARRSTKTRLRVRRLLKKVPVRCIRDSVTPYHDPRHDGSETAPDHGSRSEWGSR